MSKQMTPCEKLGYKVGDKFEVISHHAFKKGQVVTLHKDDGTECPLFAGDGGGAGVFDGVECSFATLNKQVRKIANKLKPAKQALADAIHHNGGWVCGSYAVFGKVGGRCIFCDEKPHFSRDVKSWFVHADKVVGAFSMKPFVNWHQTTLSRDEYFTAYPEQVKVEVRNETQHKVEVEMKSESEMTIKVGDWHKNGGLPPVGEVCEFVRTGDVDWHKQLNTGTEVTILAHYSPCNDGDFVAVFCHKVCDDNQVGRLVDQGASVCFRPLRTERDKAIDGIIKVINRFDFYSTLHLVAGDIAEAMFEEGYRKGVK